MARAIVVTRPRVRVTPWMRWLLATAVVGAALWYGAPALARRSGFFRVRRVEVVGARWLAPERVVRALQLRPGASVADPLLPLTARALTVPGVAEADVSRRLPGVLVVTIRERQPVAYAPVDGVLAPLDARGRILPYDARRGAMSLPVLAAPNADAARVLSRLRAAEPVLFDAVSGGWTESSDVVLVTARGRLRFDARTRADAMRAVRLVSERLTADGLPWGELDGRFAGMVIRRGSGA